MADKKNEIAEEMPEESLEELFAKLDQVAKSWNREILRWKSPSDCIRRAWKC